MPGGGGAFTQRHLHVVHTAGEETRYGRQTQNQIPNRTSPFTIIVQYHYYAGLNNSEPGSITKASVVWRYSLRASAGTPDIISFNSISPSPSG